MVECEDPRLRLALHSDGHLGGGLETRPLIDLHAQVGVGGTHTNKHHDTLTTKEECGRGVCM